MSKEQKSCVIRLIHCTCLTDILSVWILTGGVPKLLIVGFSPRSVVSGWLFSPFDMCTSDTIRASPKSQIWQKKRHTSNHLLDTILWAPEIHNRLESRTLSEQSSFNKILAGFKSRWITEKEWMYFNPANIW
jgi:hypothetical protein